MTSLNERLKGMPHRARIAIAIGGLALVAACGGGGGDGGGANGIDSLGAGFVQAFNADPNDQPVDPDGIDLTVNPSADPFNP